MSRADNFPSRQHEPGVSVVLPTSRSVEVSCDAIASIASQLTQSNDELLVIQNIRSESVRLGIHWDSKKTVRIVDEPIPGLLSGRHRGVQESQNELLVFVDDDICVETGWLDAIRAAFVDPAVHLVGGPSFPQADLDIPDWCREFWQSTANGGCMCPYLSLLDFGNERCDIDPCLVWGLNFAIRKSTLLKVGGFHPDGVPWELRRFRGDGETAVSLAIRRMGLRAVYVPEARVTHQVPQERLTIEYFKRRAYLQGISDSYSSLRKTHFDQTPPKLRSSLHIKLRRLAGRVKRRIVPNTTRVLSAVKQQISCSYQTGYSFHQQQFASDPMLRDWVLRENYWNYCFASV